MKESQSGHYFLISSSFIFCDFFLYFFDALFSFISKINLILFKAKSECKLKKQKIRFYILLSLYCLLYFNNDIVLLFDAIDEHFI